MTDTGVTWQGHAGLFSRAAMPHGIPTNSVLYSHQQALVLAKHMELLSG